MTRIERASYVFDEALAVYEEDTVESNIIDIIIDMLHLAKHQGIDMTYLMGMIEIHFNMEDGE
jgi:hypothetical protein